MREYYQKMLNQVSNPKHKAYYKKMIKGENPYKSKTTKPQKIYSLVLNMHFDSASEASRYVGKYTNYCYNCLKGVVDNKYKFILQKQ